VTFLIPFTKQVILYFTSVPTQGDKVPNSESDEVVAVFFAFHVAGMEITRSGVLVQNMCQINQKRLRPFKMEIFDTELDLLNGVVDLVIELDPDILTGWDVQQHSWGYLEARGLIHGVLEFGRRQDLESDKTKASASQILSPVRLRGNLGLRP